VDEAASIVKEAADPQANIIVGQVINPEIGDDLIITVIATGFGHDEQAAKAAVLERMTAEAPVHSAARMAQPQPALASARSAPGGEGLDRPTFLRRLTTNRSNQERLSLLPDEEWDVPTFLRKQGD
jgi:cell division protein FtsZ